MRVSRRLAYLLLAIATVASVVLPTAGVNAASTARATASVAPTAPYFFPETQHYLSGRFRQYWEDRGGLFVFGYPLTRTYYEVSTDGKTYLTQYFERARFEYHPENQQPFDVLLTLVGNEVTDSRRGEQPFQRVANPNDGRAYFDETGHTLGGDFLDFWVRWGGLQNFGFPLSEPFPEVNAANGQTYTVQYFERGRWELHPEIADPKYKVLLGLMGLERMNRVGVAADKRAPETSPPTGEYIPGNGSGPYVAQHIEYGFNTYLIGNPSGDDFNRATTDKVREAGFGWVRFQLIWKDFEPTRGNYQWYLLDRQVTAANNAGLKVMISVVKSPDWASPNRPGGLPEDLDAFYNLMRLVAGRYNGKVLAYEIWNEQNLAGEVGGFVQVAPYFEVLRNGYLGVRKNDTHAAVLFGGLTPTGVKDPTIALDDAQYLREFYAYRGGEGRQYFDALAAHPGSAANQPEWKYPDNPGPGTCSQTARERYGAVDGTCWNSAPDFYFRRIEDQRAVMEQNGDAAKQIWLTEFGWDSCAPPAPAPHGYEYCQLTNRAQQADYIFRAFQYAKTNWPWMGVMILWNLNYAAIPGIDAGDEKYGWSILGPGLTPLPAYDAVKNMPK